MGRTECLLGSLLTGSFFFYSLGISGIIEFLYEILFLYLLKEGSKNLGPLCFTLILFCYLVDEKGYLQFLPGASTLYFLFIADTGKEFLLAFSCNVICGLLITFIQKGNLFDFLSINLFLGVLVLLISSLKSREWGWDLRVRELSSCTLKLREYLYFIQPALVLGKSTGAGGRSRRRCPKRTGFINSSSCSNISIKKTL